MHRRQQLTINITAMTIVSVVAVGVVVWILGSMSLARLYDSIDQRKEQRQRLFDLQGPQEAYRRTLGGDAEVIADLNEEGFSRLFLPPADVLSFVLHVEELADQAGVRHTLSDRGLVETVRRQQRVVPSELEGLSDEERQSFEALLARRNSQGSDIDSIPARRFVIEVVGSFGAIAQFIGVLEESLPLILVESATVHRQNVEDFRSQGSSVLPPLSLQGASSGVSVAMEVRVFLEE